MGIFLTDAGKSKLEERVNTLVAEITKVREGKNTAYHSSGDTWHDNPTFNSLEQEENRIVRSIRELKSLMQQAVMVSVKERDCSKVAIGSIICCVQTSDTAANPNEMIWEIVGYGEGDADLRMISYDSPLGKTLMGMHLNESRIVKLPSGNAKVTIQAFYSNWDSVETVAPRSMPLPTDQDSSPESIPMEVFFVCGAHASGKTSIVHRLADEGVFDFVGSEIGKDLFYERQLSTQDQTARFEEEIMQLELLRDASLVNARHRRVALETWHPGNLAYVAVRNPQAYEAMVSLALSSPLLSCSRGTWLRIKKNTIRERTKTFAQNAEWAADFYEKIDGEIGNALDRLGIRQRTVIVDAEEPFEKVLSIVRDVVVGSK